MEPQFGVRPGQGVVDGRPDACGWWRGRMRAAQWLRYTQTMAEVQELISEIQRSAYPASVLFPL